MTRATFSLAATPTDVTVERIRHTLDGISGVEDVVVEPRARRVSIAYDGLPATTDRVIAALNEIDITAELTQ